MIPETIHPSFFTTNIDTMSAASSLEEISTHIEECLMNCGFAVLRGALQQPALDVAQNELQRAEAVHDESHGWRRPMIGRRRHAERADLAMTDPLATYVSKTLGQYVEISPDSTVSLRRDNRRARTGVVTPHRSESVIEVSLEGRMVVEIMQNRKRRALTHIAAGDAFMMHGNTALGYRSYNTTRLVDSDERAQRYGLVFRSRNSGASIAPLGWL